MTITDEQVRRVVARYNFLTRSANLTFEERHVVVWVHQGAALSPYEETLYDLACVRECIEHVLATPQET